MAPGALRTLIAGLVAMLLAAFATPANARASASPCHVGVGLAQDYAALATAPAQWNCRRDDWPLAAERVFLRFAVAPGTAPPEVFATRLTRFSALRLTVLAADGTGVSRDYAEADLRPATDSWTMRAVLPRLDRPVATVVVRIDGARHVGMLAEARLEPATAVSLRSTRFELLMAGLCGLLCAPFLFNFAFYRVLRQRFLVWHTGAVGFMLAQTLVTSGLINRFADPSIFWLCAISAITFGGGVVSAALFSADLIEPDKLDPIHRRLLAATALWVAGFTAYYLLASGGLRATAPTLYYLSFAPVMILFCWVMATALRRGSRAVRFQIAAWLPFLIVGAVRVGSSLGMTAVPLELEVEQHFAIVAEILITALGVIDRFMVLRRQRDHALFETRMLEEVVERDPLTGLMNRRALEQRFVAQRDEGFTTMAVIDLDHFKAINDTHGHATGDAVLRAVAAALAPDDDTVAVRYGGEEFILLLRGPDAAERAERRRAAIPARVATTVQGLDRVVTASMGLVEQAPEVARNRDFVALFAHCDRLLYEAKHNGRNRTMSERLQVFAERRSRFRRKAAASQAA